MDNNEPVLEINEKLQKLTNRIYRRPLRRHYIARFVFRCIVYVLTIIIWRFFPKQLSVVTSKDWFAFFKSISYAHFLWCVWILDMLVQLIPLQKHIPIGSQKNFRIHFRPVIESISKERIIKHIKDLTKAAYKVFVVWALLIVCIGLLYKFGPLQEDHMLLFAVTFYVCDLICVLFWCPFRVLIMKNKCCTTCRIFNWDHLMMFSPLIFLRSFYAWSLIFLAIVVWAVWEVSVYLYPERFSLFSNRALKCSECTDRLCRRPRGDKTEAGYSRN